ncbi:FadR/GntR family transcriptional regulator [Streptomyces sulphureus]|uniref:FadR/GntR family transcriptional regulator n=1 Tax=Streptomyces sulphureus TaxID=47758 RepID=UPI00037C59C4|nr:FadR/GntR family transcriptional regulator [Streptomyces sulphureus]
MVLRAAGRQSLVDTVVAQLRDQLADGEWEVGERIPTEHALAEQLQVGRNTVREAVRVLVHAGMLRSRQGEGTFVVSASDAGEVMRSVQRAGVRDVLELRVALETEAARLAATRRQPADIARMREALAALGTYADAEQRPGAGQYELFAEQDTAFHVALVESAHNVALSATYRWLSGSVRDAFLTSLRDARLPSLRDEQTSPLAPHDHAAVLEAIEAGDPERAERAMRDVLEEPRRAVDELLDGGTA